MRRRFRNVWVVTGLALLGAMAAAGEARAGISVGGGIVPTNPDPQFEYLLFLQSTVEIDRGFSFTVSDLASVLSSADSPEGWRVTFSSDNAASFSGTATWKYEGCSSIFGSTSHPYQLSGFDVFTGELTQAQSPTVGSTISYTYMLAPGDKPSLEQTFQLQNLAVPEPSSALIVLVVGGTAGGTGLIARAWRRRPARAG